MSKEQRQYSVDQFQENEKIKVFVGNIKAAGVGITLTSAEAVIMNDLSFLPSDHAQAEDRAYRFGQKNNVLVYYPIFENTIEAAIYDIINSKKQVIATVMGDGFNSADTAEEILEKIPPQCQKLILIPHVLLHLLPLHALPAKNSYLMDLFPQGVGYAPSCQLLQQVQLRQCNDFQSLFAMQTPTEDLYEKDLILMEDGKKEKDDDILALLRNKIEEEIEFLKKKRGEEEKFLIYLKDTYGEGDLIIPTLEYKLKNEEP
jgi:SNF2 family DNA or RNA helicase